MLLLYVREFSFRRTVKPKLLSVDQISGGGRTAACSFRHVFQDGETWEILAGSGDLTGQKGFKTGGFQTPQVRVPTSLDKKPYQSKPYGNPDDYPIVPYSISDSFFCPLYI